MAASVVGTGAVDPGTTGTTIAFTLPASIPANSLLLFITNNNTSPDTVTDVSNVTETLVSSQSPGTTLFSSLYSAVVGAANNSQTVTVTYSGSTKITCAWIVVSGVETTIDNSSFATDNSVDTVALLPSITPVVANTFLVSLVSGQHPTAGTTFTRDADYTARASTFYTGATPLMSSHITTLQLATGAGVARSGDSHTWSQDSRDVCFQVTLAPTTGTAHTQSPTDVAGLVDSPDIVRGRFVTPTDDSTGIVDAKSFVTNYVSTFDDSVGLVDSATPVNGPAVVPAVLGAGASANSVTAQTIAFTLPASIPDGSVLLFATNANSASGTVTGVTNVTETVLDLQRTGDPVVLSAYLFQAIVGSANNGQTITITWSNTNVKITCAWILLDGVRPTLNAFPAAINDADAGDTIAVVPPITPTVDDAFLVSFISGQHGTAGTTYTKDADYTLGGSAFYGGADPKQSTSVSYLQLTTDAGVERSGDQHDWSASSREVSWVVALQADAAAAAFQTFPTDSTGIVDTHTEVGPVSVAVDPAILSLTGIDVTATGTGTTSVPVDPAGLVLAGQETASAGTGAASTTTDTASLLLSGVDPAAAGTGVASASSDVATLILTGQTPEADAGGPSASVDPALLTLTGQNLTAAGMGIATVAVDTAILTLTGQTSAAAGTGTAQASADPVVLTLTGQTPSAAGTGSTSRTLDVAVLILGGVDVQAGSAVNVVIDPAVLSLTGLDATVSGTGDAPVTVDVAALTILGLTPTAAGAGTAAVIADTATLTLTGVTPDSSGTGAANIGADTAVLTLMGVQVIGVGYVPDPHPVTLTIRSFTSATARENN